MKNIAHRGYWESQKQQNSFEAIWLGLIYSDGVEIDLRLHHGRIVVSHDHVKNPSQLVYLSEVLHLSRYFESKLWALNIKEDGLGPYLVQELSHHPKLKYFCFDMSFPETVQYIKLKLKIASRVSDLEEENHFVSKKSTFYIQDNFKSLKSTKTRYKKNVLLISPELHNRSKDFTKLKKIAEKNMGQTYVCTDRIFDIC